MEIWPGPGIADESFSLRVALYHLRNASMLRKKHLQLNQLTTLTLAFLPILFSTTSVNSHNAFLELTAVVTKHNASNFECWRLASPFTTSTGAGTVGALTLLIDSLANATYTVFPPRFKGGIHNAPHAQ